jgi:hypothetical protein
MRSAKESRCGVHLATDYSPKRSNSDRLIGSCLAISPVKAGRWFLLQPEALIHQALQPWAVENIVGEFFVRKHAEGGAAGIRGHLGRLFQGQIGILADHGHHHAHHDLQAAQSSGLVVVLVLVFVPVPVPVPVAALIVLPAWFGPSNFHTAPVLPAAPRSLLRKTHCASFRLRIKLPLAVHLGDPQDRGIVTAVICWQAVLRRTHARSD